MRQTYHRVHHYSMPFSILLLFLLGRLWLWWAYGGFAWRRWWYIRTHISSSSSTYWYAVGRYNRFVADALSAGSHGCYSGFLPLWDLVKSWRLSLLSRCRKCRQCPVLNAVLQVVLVDMILVKFSLSCYHRGTDSKERKRANGSHYAWKTLYL